MSDIRGYSTIAEHADPSLLAAQLNAHRAEMNHAILAEGGTVMQFVGDAVMACSARRSRSADHADRALVAAHRDARRPGARSTSEWAAEGLPPFGLGIGLSTGEVAAALLGSEERLEYTLVGDTVNLVPAAAGARRPTARPCVSEPTWDALTDAAGRRATSARSWSRDATTPGASTHDRIREPGCDRDGRQPGGSIDDHRASR